MTDRSSYLLQMLDKIGAPLLAAITQGSKTQDDSAAQDAATTIAQLLAKSVATGIDVSHLLESEAGKADDSLRLAATALASGLVAAHYKTHASVPEDQDLQKMNEALKAVVSFSDNFTPDADNTARLEQSMANGNAVSPSQTMIQYLNAYIPVTGAVSAFSFGLQEQKLMGTIAERLSTRAAGIRETITTSGDADEQKRVELAVLSALAKVYESCHRSETERLMALDEAARQNAPTGEEAMAGVWQAFDTRAAMLEALVSNMAPNGGSTAPKPEATGPATPPAPNAETPPAPQSPPQEQPPSPIAQIVQKTPAPETKPETQAETPPPSPQEAPASQESPNDDQDDEGKDGKSGGEGSSNPMSFFKK